MDFDPTADSRKSDHIKLAFESRVARLDDRFYYEPMLAAHPASGAWPAFSFLGKNMRVPLWVSSMTGGTQRAATINRNLARACGEFGMGMGLGSCRQLLYSHEYLSDFDVRDEIGPTLPLYANLGIAQLEQLIDKQDFTRIEDLIHVLRADGLIIHVNPLQEAMQPEGDVFRHAPLQTVETLLEKLPFPLIVKEVGQGMGPESLRRLLQLPLAAVEFAAAGGTNFAKLELLRTDTETQNTFEPIAQVGHSAAEMLGFVRQIWQELGPECRTQQIIVSGGITDFLDGFYLIEQSPLPAVYGQASAFLQHAMGEYDALQSFVKAQVRGLELAKAFLRPR
jgi:isopentenyl-diphosphate delta-isomerase